MVTMRAAVITTVVNVRPKWRVSFRKSAAVSPTVVAKTLMIQKKIVTSGTLLSMALRVAPRAAVVVVDMASDGTYVTVCTRTGDGSRRAKSPTIAIMGAG